MAFDPALDDGGHVVARADRSAAHALAMPQLGLRLLPPGEVRRPLAAPGTLTTLQRARLLWPRLDAGRLARTRGEPERIARLVARRTALPVDTIRAMLRRDGVALATPMAAASRGGPHR
jgi:hypothetical protein